MTPRTPQCKVFFLFNSSSEFSGVPEDSKFSLLGVWASPSHLAQSEVATEGALGFLKIEVDFIPSVKNVYIEGFNSFMSHLVCPQSKYIFSI
jgi:hypothetical protein